MRLRIIVVSALVLVFLTGSIVPAAAAYRAPSAYSPNRLSALYPVLPLQARAGPSAGSYAGPSARTDDTAGPCAGPVARA